MKLLAALLLTGIAIAQDPEPGRQHFESRCTSCHGGDGAGGEHGPAIVFGLRSRSDEQLATIIREGLPTRGMPAFKLADQEMKELIVFLRTLRPRRGQGPKPAKVETLDGRTLDVRDVNDGLELVFR